MAPVSIKNSFGFEKITGQKLIKWTKQQVRWLSNMLSLFYLFCRVMQRQCTLFSSFLLYFTAFHRFREKILFSPGCGVIIRRQFLYSNCFGLLRIFFFDFCLSFVSFTIRLLFPRSVTNIRTMNIRNARRAQYAYRTLHPGMTRERLV